MTDHPPSGIVEADPVRVRAVIAQGFDPRSPYCPDIAGHAPYGSPYEQAKQRRYDAVVEAMD
jgi:hypothetical protein